MTGEKEAAAEEARVGLCHRCRHAQRVPSGKGATYYLCRLSREDPRFPKYPALPVLACPGFAAEGEPA